MAYLQHTSWRDRPGAVVGVVAIHAAIGYALVTGLSYEGIAEVVKNTKSVFVPEVKLPPPPPPPKTEPQPDSAQVAPPLHAPLPPIDLGPQRPPIDAVDEVVIIPDLIPRVVPSPTPGPIVRPSPKFDAIAARPRNNPGTWVTTDDYRSNWINRELTGSARFKVTVAGTGKVESCTITNSSGHPELDKATCDLVTKRARFDPAKDETGTATTGTYSSSVRWELPE